jgi:hypothetical protein
VTAMDATEKQAQAQRRLADLRRVIAIKWKPQEIPQNVLEMGCDLAYLAAETDQKRERSVRNWLHSKVPHLTQAEVDAHVARTTAPDRNRRWNSDQLAGVARISVRFRQKHKTWNFGADDDPNYDIRNAIKAEKHAARSRKYRAAHGAVPRAVYEANSISNTEPWKQEGFGCRRTWERWRKKAAAEAANVASACRDLSLRITSVTDLRHDHLEQIADSRAPKAPRRHARWDDDVVDRIDDPEQPPFAIAAGVTKVPKVERRTAS